MTACNYCMQDDHTVRLAKARPCLTCINPPEHQSLSVVEVQDCTTSIALASRSSCGVPSASWRPRGLPSLGGLLGRSARFRCGRKAQVSCHVLLSEPTWSQLLGRWPRCGLRVERGKAARASVGRQDQFYLKILGNLEQLFLQGRAEPVGSFPPWSGSAGNMTELVWVGARHPASFEINS